MRRYKLRFKFKWAHVLYVFTLFCYLVTIASIIGIFNGFAEMHNVIINLANSVAMTFNCLTFKSLSEDS